jgi:hypothetical protein
MSDELRHIHHHHHHHHLIIIITGKACLPMFCTKIAGTSSGAFVTIMSRSQIITEEKGAQLKPRDRQTDRLTDH